MAPTAAKKKHFESTLLRSEEQGPASTFPSPTTTTKQARRYKHNHRRTTTATSTRVVTVTLLDDNIPSLSTSALPLQHSPASHLPADSNSCSRRLRQTSTFVSSVRPSLRTDTTLDSTQHYTLSSASPTTMAIKSTYPRPSPPSFWYTNTIAPRGAYDGSSGLGDMSGDGNGDGGVIWSLPYGLEGVVILVLVLGFIWTVLSFCLTFPPRSWRLKTSWKQSRPGNANGNGVGCGDGNGYEQAGEKDRRLLDEPTKYAPAPTPATYAPLPESSPLSASNTGSLADDVAGMSATGVQTPRITFADQNGEGLTRRTQRRRGIYTPGDRSGMILKHQRSRSTPPSAIRISVAEGVTAGALPSPENSFLQPPLGDIETQETGGNAVCGLKPRSSGEWLTARDAFFFSDNSTLPSPSNTPTHPTHDFDTADIEALEAGTAPPTPRGLKAPSRDNYPKSKSWADLKLSIVEDTVNGWVGSLARWTDDTGGDEGVLLPMVREDGRGFRKMGKIE